MTDKIKRNLIISIIFSVVVYAALSLYSQSENILSAFSKINYFNIPLILFLSFLTFFFRFVKWQEYNKYLRLKIPFKNSFVIYFSTLVMSITPGKAGELIKCYMLKKDFNSPVSITSSILFAERLTEMLSLIIMALAGALLFGVHIELMIGAAVLFIGLIYILTHENICVKLLKLLTGIKFLRKYEQGFINAYKSIVELIKPKILGKMILLSIISWVFECYAFYLILINFNPEATIALATFVFTFSIIAGSLSMIPGGIGVAEGSLTLLLTNFGFSYPAAVASTLILRICTLWFSVLLGIIFLSIYQSKYGRVKVET